MEGDRRNLSRRAMALSRVVTAIAARTNAEISEDALAEMTTLPDAAVHRILRRLARQALVRRVSRNTWAAARFMTQGCELRVCPTDL